MGKDIEYSCNGMLFLRRLLGEEGKPVRRYRRRMHNFWKK